MPKITGLTQLTTPQPLDLLEIVDVSNTAEDASGSSRRITDASYRKGDFVGAGPEVGGVRYGMPGVELLTVGVRVMTTSRMYYQPIMVDMPITVDALMSDVVVAAGTSARLGLFTANSAWQPSSVYIDAGLISTASTGIKTASFTPIVLPVGRYLLALVPDSAVQFRFCSGMVPFGEMSTLAINTPFTLYYFAASVGTGALTVVPWDNRGSSATPSEYYVTLRITDVEQ